MKRSLVLLLTLCAAPAAAQSGANPVVGSVTPMFETTTRYLQAAAEQMPEADYGYRPTPEIRTFAQLIGHVAGAQNMFCSMALGEQEPGGRNLEELTDKAALVEALRASTALCTRAYAQSDQSAMQTVQMFGQERTRLAALITNAAHNFEHYGNIVTYMRLKGMVPPSSQPQRD
jgi:uncharacterized damage-inducible protein DinB